MCKVRSPCPSLPLLATHWKLYFFSFYFYLWMLLNLLAIYEYGHSWRSEIIKILVAMRTIRSCTNLFITSFFFFYWTFIFSLCIFFFLINPHISQVIINLVCMLLISCFRFLCFSVCFWSIYVKQENGDQMLCTFLVFFLRHLQ